MRNRVQISDQIVDLDFPVLASCLAIDSPSSSLYYVCQTETGIAIAARTRSGDTKLYPIPGLNDDIIGVEYIPEHESVCVLSSAGSVYLVPVHNDQVPQLVGVFDDGISAASWSSDRERCVIATMTKRLVVITHDWDVIDEVDIDGVASSISWRSDCTRFSAIIKSSVYLFDQNGAQIAKTIDDEFLHDAIAGQCVYRPSGDMITVSVDHDAGSQGTERRVAILEGANCLRHGQWTIDTDEMITGLSWSADSTAIAIALQTSILIYERNNYRWYLKNEIMLEMRPTLIQWDRERNLRLHIVIGNQIIRIIDFAHDIARSESGAVAVIDGKTILVTDFSRMVVPPPMSMFECQSPSSVISLSWSLHHSLAALTSHNTIAIYDDLASAEFGVNLSPTRLISCDLHHLHQIVWSSSTTLIALRSTRSGDALVFIDLADDRDQTWLALPSRAVRLDQHGVQLDDGRILRYSNLTPFAQLSSPCQRFYTTSTGLAIGLDDMGRLYLNDNLLAQSASSFVVVAPATLLFTTTGAQHVLHAVDLTSPDHAVHSQRHLERGAILVSVVPALDRVVLQILPRGSLETIYPRALLLKSVADLLHDRRWSDVFHCMRRHRLDFNLIYDADPNMFTAEIPEFVAGVGHAALLNEFIAALVDRNTRETIYKEYRPVVSCTDRDDHDDYHHLSSLAVDEGSHHHHHHRHDDFINAPTSIGKINHICRLIFDAAAGNPDLVLAQLGALLKQTPAQYEQALQLIASLPAEQRPAALRFVTSVVEVDVLFDAALGLYDFDLVRMVGRVSDKDPKEYLGLIRDLQSRPVLAQRIAIDTQLQRYVKVLHHLSQMDPVPIDHVLNILSAHSDLFPTAFTLFPAQPAVLTAFAASSSCAEPGLVYAAAGDRHRALQSYREAGDWRGALNIAYELGDIDVVALARDMADTMSATTTSASIARDAAHIYIDICADIESAVRVLCQTELWNESLLTARRYQEHRDLVGTIVWPAILKSTRRHLADLEYATERWRYCIGRLRLLQRSATPTAFEDDERFDEQTQTDTNLSAYTLTSQVSVQSWASTPWSIISSVRRRERKSSSRRAVKMREGDAREPAFLTKLVRTLAPDTDKMEKMARMIRVLITGGKLQEARLLQGQFDGFVSMVRESIDEMPELEISVPDLDWKVQFLPAPDQSECDRRDVNKLDAIHEDDDEGAAFQLF